MPVPSATACAAEPLLSVRGLACGVRSADGQHEVVVDDVSFDLAAGRVVALVGRSGSGKTLAALSVMRLLPARVRVLSGQVLLNGRDVLALSERELARVRGRELGIVFQEPGPALSPLQRIGVSLGIAVASGALRSEGLGWLRRRRRIRERCIELLREVALPDPELLVDAYPHQLSAGMRRRVLVAMAVAAKPSVLLADEPTRGLDPAVRGRVLDVLSNLARQHGSAVLFISHDLNAVAEVADDVLVMRSGRIVESGSVRRVFEQPSQPYTAQLLGRASEPSAQQAAAP